MTFAATILTLIAEFTLLSLLVIWGYHFLYRRSLTVVGKFELERVAPALVPSLVLALWLLGLADSSMSSGFIPNHLWVWWMPIGAPAVFIIGTVFARWNRARLINKSRVQL